MSPRHLLDIASVGPDALRRMLELSNSKKPLRSKPLAGEGVALIFEKPSNRTRHSMEMAVVQLGGHPVYTRGEEVGFDVREPVEDVARIMAGYHGALAARVFAHSTVERMASVSTVPVINMLSDLAHPLQALADVITMEEHVGPVSSHVVAWIGDYNNVARSLGESVCMLGGTMSFGCPDGYGPDSAELSRLESLGGTVRNFSDPAAAVSGAHVVHTDTWVSMGQEAETAERMAVFASYIVDEDLMSLADPSVRFMHCMPAYRGKEVSAGVFDGPASLVIEQGHHRLTGARGALAWAKGM